MMCSKCNQAPKLYKDNNLLKHKLQWPVKDIKAAGQATDRCWIDVC